MSPGTNEPDSGQGDLRLLRHPLDHQLQHVGEAMLLRHVEQQPLVQIDVDGTNRGGIHDGIVGELS